VTAGDPAERLYTRFGRSRVSVIPGYAFYPDGRLCDTAVFWKPSRPVLRARAVPGRARPWSAQTQSPCTSTGPRPREFVYAKPPGSSTASPGSWKQHPVAAEMRRFWDRQGQSHPTVNLSVFRRHPSFTPVTETRPWPAIGNGDTNPPPKREAEALAPSGPGSCAVASARTEGVLARRRAWRSGGFTSLASRNDPVRVCAFPAVEFHFRVCL
jgi:hypothetical protein